MKYTTSAGRLADAFCRALERAIGTTKVKRAAERNRLPAYAGDACASHDFCDANEAMAEAFKEVTLRDMDTQSESDIALWGEAWGIAKANGLRPVGAA